MKSDAIAREVLRRQRRSPLAASTFAETVQDVETVKQLHSMVADVKAFHEKFGIDYKGKPRALEFELSQFRLKFMREEMTEYEKHSDQAMFLLDQQQPPLDLKVSVNSAAIAYHLAGMVDALMDLVYVALGTAHLQGFDVEKAWERVHEANMAKERPAGEARNAEERIKLKMVKPPGWETPDHLPEVEDNAHKT